MKARDEWMWVQVVEKALRPRVNLRSRVLIRRNREEHEQRPEGEREHSGPAVTEETRQGLS